MIVRRIREHAAAQNWLAVTLDFAIVVAGVFLGIQVSNWNEARGERQLAENYRSRLVVELKSNEAQLRQKIRYYQAAKRHGLALLNSIDRPVEELGTQFLIDAYQLTQIDPARGKRFIFDEMVSAALLGLVGSEDDQRLASDFYQQLELYDATLLEVFPYRDTLRQEMPYAVQTQIRSECGDKPVRHDGKFAGIGLPDACQIDLSQQELSFAVTKVRSIPNLTALATRYLSSVDQKLGNFEDTLEQATTLRQALSRPK